MKNILFKNGLKFIGNILIIFLFLFITEIQVSASPPHPLKKGRAPHEDVYSAPTLKKPWNRNMAILGSSGSKEIILLRCEFQEDSDPETTGNGLMSKNKAYFDDMAVKFNKYYMDNSYGKLDLKVTVSDKVYKLSHEMSYYGQGSESSSKLILLFNELIDLSNSDIDFSKYDSVIVAHAGYGQESDVARQGAGDTPNDIWSVFINSAAKSADGKVLTSFVIFPEREDQDNHPENSSFGIMVHEFGHQLGLPDLYDIDNSSLGIGDWGLMGYGAWVDNGNTPSMLSAWSRKYLNFINPTPVSSDNLDISLKSAETSDEVVMVYVSDKSTNEYFLIENRNRSGWDLHQKGEGILIWHIDDSVGTVSGNNVNSNDSHRRVDLECANGLDSNGKDDLDYNDDKHPSGSKDHPFYLSGKNYFAPITNPSSLAYNNKDGNLSLRVKSDPSPSMNMSLSKVDTILKSESKIDESYTYPNPVRSGSCRFRYNLHFAASNVIIKIYNSGGKLVNKFDASNKVGENDFIFFPIDSEGRNLKNGVYFYKIVATSGSSSARTRGRFVVVR